jgi:hypothetical protein
VNRILLFIVAAAALSWPAWGQKVEVEKPDRGKILRVETALNHLTVLEMSEPVSTVAVGSPVFKVEWRENKVFIEPTEPDVATNLFVWTASGRFNYELDPAGAVPQMDFAIDQPVPDPPPWKASASRAGDPADPSPADILIAAKPVRLFGPIAEKNRVTVYVTDLFEHDGQVLIRYSIRNGTGSAYMPGNPQAVALKAPRFGKSLYGLKSSQLGTGALSHLKSSGEIPIEIVKGEIRSSRIAPGQETSGVLAIKLPAMHAEPAVIRLVFLASSRGGVEATLVL